jgi:hypothetical protein
VVFIFYIPLESGNRFQRVGAVSYGIHNFSN